MYVDDLPIWALVGDHGEGGGNNEESYIWTHKRFDFGVHGNQVRSLYRNKNCLDIVSDLTDWVDCGREFDNRSKGEARRGNQNRFLL